MDKRLFWELCRFLHADANNIRELLLQGAATPSLLGHLFMNRLAPLAYGVLRGTECLSQVPREFRTALCMTYEQNRKRNDSFFESLRLVRDALADVSAPYAMLKGSWLCQLYPAAYRSSHDIDLLIRPQDLTAVGTALEAAGFRQGSLQNDRFVPASRAEIISSRMMRGETVPYIKEVDLPFLSYLEVDLNFSLDYKAQSPVVLENMLAHRTLTADGPVPIFTLATADFMLHLCAHLYKEATTYPWIRMKRDMALYKYVDLYYMVSTLSPQERQAVKDRACELGLELPCWYALQSMKELLEPESAALDCILGSLHPGDPSLLHQAVDPEHHQLFCYKEQNLRTRFWCQDRAALLQEVKS